MRKYGLTLASIVLLSVATASPAFGVSREIIQMMQQLDTLQQTVQNLQNTVTNQTAILRTLIEQTAHDVSLIKSNMADLQQHTEQNMASSSNKLDSLTSQIQALSSSLEQTQAQLTKVSEQVAHTQNIIQTLNTAPPSTAGATPIVPGQSANGSTPGTANSPVPPGTPDTAGSAAANVPGPTSLYNSAMTSFNSGQYALAIQGFQEFLQYYGNTPSASSAQYYIGECYYNNGDYPHAIAAYDKVIERYPKSNKALSARLKKGYALLANGQRAAGINELRALVEQHPSAQESELAAQRLRRLGIIIRARRSG